MSWLFQWMLKGSCKVSPSLGYRVCDPWLPTRKSNLDLSDYRTLSHFEIVHLKWVLAHRMQHFWTIIKHGFISAWLSFGVHLQMAPRIVFTDSEIWRDRYWHNHANEWCSIVGEPKDQSVQQMSSMMPLVHSIFSSFSASFAMLCRWGDLQSFCNRTLKNCDIKGFWLCSTD